MSDLGHHQTYLIEEFAEDYLHKHLARRDLVKRVLLITGSVPLTASVLFSLGCSGGGSDTKPAATASSGVAAPPTAVPTPVGPGVPENDPAITAAAVAFPGERRIVMQGRNAGSDAGDPISVLRHELAHLALHEAMGDLPPRWFDEGYASFAAAETGRDQVLSTNVALVFRGVPCSQPSCNKASIAGRCSA